MQVSDLLTKLKDRERSLRQESDDALYAALADVYRRSADEYRRVIAIVENELIKHTYRKVYEEAK